MSIKTDSWHYRMVRDVFDGPDIQRWYFLRLSVCFLALGFFFLVSLPGRVLELIFRERVTYEEAKFYYGVTALFFYTILIDALISRWWDVVNVRWYQYLVIAAGFVMTLLCLFVLSAVVIGGSYDIYKALSRKHKKHCY